VKVISDDFKTRATEQDITLADASDFIVDEWARAGFPEAIRIVLSRKLSHRFNPNHDKATGHFGSGHGGGVLGPAQFEALRPSEAGFSKTRRDAATAALEVTPEGRTLSRVIEDFQGPGGPQLQADIAAVNARGRAQTAAGTQRAKTFLAASTQVPHDMLPPKLYRGMAVRGNARDIAARYRQQALTTINASSFTSSSQIAHEYTTFLPGQGNGAKVNVIMEVSTRGKTQMLPVGNLATTADRFRDKEFIGLGTFKITTATVRGDTVNLKLEQTGLILAKEDQ